MEHVHDAMNYQKLSFAATRYPYIALIERGEKFCWFNLLVMIIDAFDVHKMMLEKRFFTAVA